MFRAVLEVYGSSKNKFCSIDNIDVRTLSHFLNMIFRLQNACSAAYILGTYTGGCLRTDESGSSGNKRGKDGKLHIDIYLKIF